MRRGFHSQLGLIPSAWHSLTEEESRAVYAKPDAPSGNGCLTQGEALMAGKRYNDAVTAFQKAVDLDQQSAPAWFALGAAAHRAGNLTLAISSFQSGLTLAPKDKAAQIYL